MYIYHVFSFRSRFSFPDTDDTQHSRGRGRPSLFLSTNSNRSRQFRYLFATLYVGRPPRVFNRIVSSYQTATRWDLSPHWITVWPWNYNMTLLDNLNLCFYYGNLTRKTGGFELASTITLSLQTNWLTKSLVTLNFLYYPVTKYLLKVNNRNTRKKYKICLKLTTKRWNDLTDVVLAFFLLTLNIF